jgi:predicted permease
MNRWRILIHRLLGKGRGEAELDEEIGGHLDLIAREYEERGLTAEEARLAARRAFGGVAQIKEVYREQRRLPFLDTFAQDLVYALRQLRKNPGFAAAAVLTLALGIGANAAIYQVLDAVLLRPLPVKDPQRLVQVQLRENNKPVSFAYPLFREMVARQQVVETMFASSEFPMHEPVLRGRGRLQSARGLLASGDYFRALGISASLGRVFTAADDRAAAPVAVISHAFWDRELGRSPAAIGQVLEINKAVVTIIGVAPAGFFGERVGGAPDVWLPIALEPQVMAMDWLNAPTATWLTVMARLRPDTPTTPARKALDALYHQLIEFTMQRAGVYQRRLDLEPAAGGINHLEGEFKSPLLFLMAVVGLVLLISCCNLANLLLGRARARAHEMGVRLALGAARARLVRQLLTESLVLSVLGALLALLLAWRGAYALVALASPGGDWQLPLGIGWRALGFTAGVGLLATCLFGLAPALAATRVDVHAALQASWRGHTAGRSKHLLAKSLVIAQISIALMLLSGAALLVRSLWNLRHQDFGFRGEGVLLVDLPVEFSKGLMARHNALRQPLYDRMNSLPGVQSAALSGFGLMGGMQHTGNLSSPDRPSQDGDFVRLIHVSPRYFETMGIRITAGRALTADDRQDSPKAAVLSETAAETLFGSADRAVGRFVSLDKQFYSKTAWQVVGVARNVRFADPRDPFGILVYLPLAQQPTPATAVMLRKQGDPLKLVAPVRALLHELDPNLLVGKVTSLTDAIDLMLARERTLALLSTCFGLLALLLTSVGVYGVISYAVVRRTQEIGIRLALGAARRSVAGMLMRDVAMLVAVSAMLGGAGAVAMARAMRSMLFGFGSAEYSLLVVSGLVLAAVAAGAGYLPARRAARLDPMEALRQE